MWEAHDFHSFNINGLLFVVQSKYSSGVIYYLTSIAISGLLKTMCVNIVFLSYGEHNTVCIPNIMFCQCHHFHVLLKALIVYHVRAPLFFRSPIFISTLHTFASLCKPASFLLQMLCKLRMWCCFRSMKIQLQVCFLFFSTILTNFFIIAICIPLTHYWCENSLL